MLIETVATGKFLLILGWLYFLYKTARTGRPKWALLGVLYIGALSIIIEKLPLEVGYGLPCVGCDMAAYVGQAMTYAVGNPFGEDFAYQGIPAMYSPIYPYIVAVVHWITGFNVIRIYDYGAVIAFIILALLFFYFGCPRDPVNSPDKREIPWVGILMAFFFIYMSTIPVRWIGHSPGFWPLILYKPTHTLSFFFLPILYFYMSKRFKWYYVLIAGIALGAMVPTFIVTAVFISCGLAVYCMLVFLFDRMNFIKEMFKTLLVGLIGLLCSIWWWWPIFITHGFSVEGTGMGGSVPAIFWSDAKVVFDPFEATFFMLPLFWLGIIGIIVMFNRRRRGDFLILGLIVAMYLGKFIYPFSWVLFNFAPQAYECSMFFLKPAMAMAASVGIYAIVEYIVKNYEKIKEFLLNQPVFDFLSIKIKKIAPSLSRLTWDKMGAVIACCLLILTPYASSVWYISGQSGHPLPEDIVDYSDWIKKNTPYNAVFLTDGTSSMTISTYTGRKLMRDLDGRSAIVDFQQRLKDANTIFTSQDDNATRLLIDKYNIGYIMITGDTRQEYPNINLDRFYDDEFFTVVYHKGDIMIFKVKQEEP